ncbi:histidine kinase [Acuticoccus sediminis]|uniref:Histidine kinase n=1 Tax=Acuticoccus sediminis TaxID=2184697 RepID=A0A8B2NK75_9HYPH|nr:oxygenase MpaB family protein [Acuticoccus sediminis]RAH96326.1 histidine kinase [Acuticoccus sediminis]
MSLQNARSPLSLPPFIERRLDEAVLRLTRPADAGTIDFSVPAGEAALIAPDSISWKIFRNPVALFCGGVAAVILELAEPSVRTGVWEHSSFRRDPVRRLQRTGQAAMVTVYGPRSVSERMIAGVVRMHEHVSGETPGGVPYRANDVALLDWVQATATFGFATAYSRYVRPLDDAALSRVFAEARASAQLYGAAGAPGSVEEWRAMLDGMRGRLEPSPIVFEFLELMRTSPALPGPLRPLQRLMVRGAVELVPAWVRERLGLSDRDRASRAELAVLRRLGRSADRVLLPSSPAVQSCRRLGVPTTVLTRW